MTSSGKLSRFFSRDNENHPLSNNTLFCHSTVALKNEHLERYFPRVTKLAQTIA